MVSEPIAEVIGAKEFFSYGRKVLTDFKDNVELRENNSRDDILMIPLP